jgi:hypothetical protein
LLRTLFAETTGEVAMDRRHWLAVTDAQTLRFFFERLKDVSPPDATPRSELLYNASLLAHYATTSTRSTTVFPPTPASLSTIFDVFVLDRSQHVDPSIMEAAASQCLLLTGFFGDQLRRRHNITWYASLGAGFYERAAALASDPKRAHMMTTMAGRFDFWRVQQTRLAKELRDVPRLLFGGISPDADISGD